MNFVFRSYPSHPWIPDWTFEPDRCHADYREKCADRFFRSQGTVGRIVPNIATPDWAIQVPVPQNSRINLLANGFCAYFEHKKIKCGAEVITPEPGVLWGRFQGIPAPLFTVEIPAPQQNDGSVWLETDSDHALLATRGAVFCLVTKSAVREDAERVAEGYFSADLENELRQQMERRSGATALFEQMSHHDSLTVICVETLAKALRPPEGRIPHLWSQASGEESAQLDINELHPVALAWSLINPKTAEELILSALKIQTNSGAIPVRFSPKTAASILEAPKPLISKTAEEVWKIRKDPEFLDAALPMLRRHIQWMLHHFDPKRRGIYCWKSRKEPLVPELYESDMAAVDLAVLLLTEIEAFNRMHACSPRHAGQPPPFEEERLAIGQSIMNQFWNDSEAAFTNAFIRDAKVQLHGFPSLVPLLWEGLPSMPKSALLESIRATEDLPGKPSILNWRPSALDDRSFPLMQQLLVLQALETAAPHGSLLSDFSRLTLQRVVEWHSQALELESIPPIDPALAAYVINVQAMRKYRYHGKDGMAGRLSGILRKTRADRTDLIVIAATLLLAFCVHIFYNDRREPPPYSLLEARINGAYAERNATETLLNCKAIVDHYPDHAAKARLLSGNIMMFDGNFPDAETMYAEVRRENPDSPGAMVSLGLALQLQGRFDEAETNYYEFCYLFDEIFPTVVDEVNTYRHLMEEGFNAPPKWREIYRYQFMHEL